jgi:dTDP-glucose 4,6-dehydratase
MPAGMGEEINTATQCEISMGDLVRILANAINPDVKVKEDDTRIRPSKSEVGRLLGSNSKITKLTNWRQNYVLEEGLRETIEWFKKKENLQVHKRHIYNV